MLKRGGISLVAQARPGGREVVRIRLDVESRDQAVHEVEQSDDDDRIVDRSVVPTSHTAGLEVRVGHAVGRLRHRPGQRHQRLVPRLDRGAAGVISRSE